MPLLAAVFYPGQHKAVNLHAVWDTWILRDMMGSHRVADFADTLEHAITPAQMKEWAKGDPEAWASESHRAAIDGGYLAALVVFGALFHSSPPGSCVAVDALADAEAILLQTAAAEVLK